VSHAEFFPAGSNDAVNALEHANSGIGVTRVTAKIGHISQKNRRAPRIAAQTASVRAIPVSGRPPVPAAAA